MYTQVQQEAGLLIGVNSNGSAAHALVAEDESALAKTEPTPTKRPRGRPRKYPKPVSTIKLLLSMFYSMLKHFCWLVNFSP